MSPWKTTEICWSINFRTKPFQVRVSSRNLLPTSLSKFQTFDIFVKILAFRPAPPIRKMALNSLELEIIQPVFHPFAHFYIKKLVPRSIKPVPSMATFNLLLILFPNFLDFPNSSTPLKIAFILLDAGTLIYFAKRQNLIVQLNGQNLKRIGRRTNIKLMLIGWKINASRVLGFRLVLLFISWTSGCHVSVFLDGSPQRFQLSYSS